MKKFKHKKLGWIVEDILDGYKRVTPGKTYYYEQELIENSSDREEIIEEDWIRLAIDSFQKEEEIKLSINKQQALRQHIMDNLPKITEEELKSIQKEAPSRGDERDMVIDLLRSKGLLAE